MVLLDHKVIHWGDPAFDLGFIDGPFSEQGALFGPTNDGSLPTPRAAIWRKYRETLGPVSWRDGLEVGRFGIHWVVSGTGCRPSPLEYLDRVAAQWQRAAVVPLMRRRLSSVDALIDNFLRDFDPCPRSTTFQPWKFSTAADDPRFAPPADFPAGHGPRLGAQRGLDRQGRSPRTPRRRSGPLRRPGLPEGRGPRQRGDLPPSAGQVVAIRRPWIGR